MMLQKIIVPKYIFKKKIKKYLGPQKLDKWNMISNVKIIYCIISNIKIVYYIMSDGPPEEVLKQIFRVFDVNRLALYYIVIAC